MADGTAQGRWRRLRLPGWIGEIVLVVVLYLIYELARGVPDGAQASADHVGRTLLRWEHALHIDPEKWLTVHLDHVTWLAVPASYFYAAAHYVVTPIVLIWLYVRHRHAYTRGRTWLAISTLMSLLIFYLVPTTPPRLLGRGFPDVLKDMSDYGWWGGAGSAPRGLGHLTNQLAAMPSMHVGWALWCGVMIYRSAPYVWVRALGVLYPCVTTIVVISTGNHYLLDTVGGALTMAVGAALTMLAYRLRDRLLGRYRARLAAPDASASEPVEHEQLAAAQNSLHTTRG